MSTHRNMSAEWWAAEADRYCGLHIASHQQMVALQAELNSALDHLSRLVDWGWGEGAPPQAITDWEMAAEFVNDLSPIVEGKA